MTFDLGLLPGLNAALNSISAILIASGIAAIKGRNRQLHRRLMIGAAATSVIFLISYVIKTVFHGTTPYGGEGVLRTIYFLVLFSHLLLAMAVVPLVLRTIYLAWKKRFDAHRRWARWTYPIWLYVSVTGVLVFFMLRPYY